MERTVAAAVVIAAKKKKKLVYGHTLFPKINLRNGVSTTGQGLLTTLTLPDTNSSTLDSVLTTESTGVSSVLSDFHLLYSLSERGTITSTVFTSDSDYIQMIGD